MRDFKHISRNKPIFRFSSIEQRNINTLKNLIESKPSQRHLRVILPIFAVILATYPVINLLVSTRNAQSSVEKTATSRPPKLPLFQQLDNAQGFQFAATSLPSARFINGSLQAPLSDGGTVVYAIDQELQQRVEKVLRTSRVPYGVFVAIEPKSGKILAMVAHSEADPAWEANSYFNSYPMASLFKIVTAAAALEQKKVSPETVFAFRGKLTSENPRLWDVKPGKRNQEMPLASAMGKSVNPVFGRLASDVVGRDTIVTYAARFGFNQTLLPGTCVKPSSAGFPQNDAELKLMGAGLCHEVKISPLHAASMMAAIANNGVMMLPALAQEIKNSRGETVFIQKNSPLRSLVTPATAGQLTRMLATTVNSGTSRKAFHDRRGRARLASLNIAAKTGSINGNDPAGHYNWFAAYAPTDAPQIALVALVINHPKWKIKASYVGEQALEAFFK
jgi:cell division protein FtsI/penicillin-binding protein 2